MILFDFFAKSMPNFLRFERLFVDFGTHNIFGNSLKDVVVYPSDTWFPVA